MTFPHPGIRIHDIPAEGVGGGIFALGTAAILLMQYPALLPVAVAAVAGGAVLAPILHRFHLHRL